MPADTVNKDVLVLRLVQEMKRGHLRPHCMAQALTSGSTYASAQATDTAIETNQQMCAESHTVHFIQN